MAFAFLPMGTIPPGEFTSMKFSIRERVYNIIIPFDEREHWAWEYATNAVKALASLEARDSGWQALRDKRLRVEVFEMFKKLARKIWEGR